MRRERVADINALFESNVSKSEPVDDPVKRLGGRVIGSTVVEPLSNRNIIIM